jgi:hypothetical protein
MEKVTIVDFGTSSNGVWLLVQWELKDCDFYKQKFLSAKALNPKWKKGEKLDVPKTLLK